MCIFTYTLPYEQSLRGYVNFDLINIMYLNLFKFLVSILMSLRFSLAILMFIEKALKCCEHLIALAVLIVCCRVD